MYLKFKTNSEANGWRMFEADDIQWHHFSAEEFEAMLADYLLLDEVDYENFTGDDRPECEVCMVTLRSRNGQYNEIYTINEAFLLGDSGKTIERIN